MRRCRLNRSAALIRLVLEAQDLHDKSEQQNDKSCSPPLHENLIAHMDSSQFTRNSKPTWHGAADAHIAHCLGVETTQLDSGERLSSGPDLCYACQDRRKFCLHRQRSVNSSEGVLAATPLVRSPLFATSVMGPRNATDAQGLFSQQGARLALTRDRGKAQFGAHKVARESD